MPSSRRTAKPKSAPTRDPSSVGAIPSPVARTEERAAAPAWSARGGEAPLARPPHAQRRRPRRSGRTRARDGRARSCADDGTRRARAVIAVPAHRTARASVRRQYGARRKQPLAQRIRVCACGIEMRRDRSSAGLAQRVGGDCLHPADTARTRRSGAEPLLTGATPSCSPARGGRFALPPSPPLIRSGSPVDEGNADAENRAGGAPPHGCGEVRGAAAAAPRSLRRSPWGGSGNEKRLSRKPSLSLHRDDRNL